MDKIKDRRAVMLAALNAIEQQFETAINAVIGDHPYTPERLQELGEIQTYQSGTESGRTFVWRGVPRFKQTVSAGGAVLEWIKGV